MSLISISLLIIGNFSLISMSFMSLERYRYILGPVYYVESVDIFKAMETRGNVDESDQFSLHPSFLL